MKNHTQQWAFSVLLSLVFGALPNEAWGQSWCACFDGGQYNAVMTMLRIVDGIEVRELPSGATVGAWQERYLTVSAKCAAMNATIVQLQNLARTCGDPSLGETCPRGISEFNRIEQLLRGHASGCADQERHAETVLRQAGASVPDATMVQGNTRNRIDQVLRDLVNAQIAASSTQQTNFIMQQGIRQDIQGAMQAEQRRVAAQQAEALRRQNDAITRQQTENAEQRRVVTQQAERRRGRRKIGLPWR